MKLAIIGGGPRGLSALESLYAQAAQENLFTKIKTTVFEETNQLGNGPVYNLEQPDSNWLNVSERGLTIPKREAIISGALKIPAFPSYQDWCNYNNNSHGEDEVDEFPFRSTLGKYLRERFNSIADILLHKKLLEIKYSKVVNVDYLDKKLVIDTGRQNKYIFDEVVLAIGHQPTEIDQQIKNWKDQIENKNELILLENPYPVSSIKNAIYNTDTVGLRGFGLAMIDAVRAIASENGNFKIVGDSTREMIYRPSNTKPIKIIPFSLDGLPMTPKPLNKKIDKWFIPTDKELRTFKNALQNAIAKEENLENGKFVLNAIAPIVKQKFLTLENRALTHQLSSKELENLIISWLADENVEHDLIISKDKDTCDSMREYVGMAVGEVKISLDYCAGQVWRHCQPIMYKQLSFRDLDETVIATLINRDERLKRYSYGPPVDSLQQLIALVDEGTLLLDFVENPDITVTKTGWKLKKNSKTITTQVMVDTVLDSPKLKKVKSPIVKSLLYDSLVKPLHSDLAIGTYKNALVQLGSDKTQIPLAILGRLAKGTLIGVDAILECFGLRSELWAEGVTKRLSS